jgi:protein-tyrosine phosphatase
VIDIHCHILPGLDDGASDWDVSLEMARLAAADGISTIIATPHQGDGKGTDSGETIRQRCDQFGQLLRQHQIPITVYPGSEIRINANLVDRVRGGDWLTLGDLGEHVLLELPHDLFISPEQILKELNRYKMVGVLAHIERNEGVLANPRLLEPLLDDGCLVQVTAASILGKFGPKVEKLSHSLISDGNVHFIATDSHGSRNRTPRLREAYLEVCRRWGAETADLLFYENPRAIFNQEPVISPRSLNIKRRFMSGWLGRRAA